MALKKLTLSVDEAVIEKARRYSTAHDTSISRLVTQFLSRLPSRGPRLNPVVERLAGILPPNVDAEDYYRHLSEKHDR